LIANNSHSACTKRIFYLNNSGELIWHGLCMTPGVATAGRVQTRCNGGLGLQDDGVPTDMLAQALQPVRAPFLFLRTAHGGHDEKIQTGDDW
jgi:hypothetical protein